MLALGPGRALKAADLGLISPVFYEVVLSVTRAAEEARYLLSTFTALSAPFTLSTSTVPVLYLLLAK